MNIPTLLRLGLTAAVLGLAVLALAVPAFAKGGPPPWAGAGGNGGGPPSWAGGAKDAGEQAAKVRGAAKQRGAAGLKKAAKKRAKAREQAGKNPAMTCFDLLDELGDAFFETFGTNENKANAFGKCVSEEAHRQGEGGEDEVEEDAAEEPAECEEPAEETAELALLDQDPPAEGECDPAEEDSTGEDGDAGVEAPELACFLPAAARANPFAVCVRA